MCGGGGGRVLGGEGQVLNVWRMVRTIIMKQMQGFSILEQMWSKDVKNVSGCNLHIIFPLPSVSFSNYVNCYVFLKGGNPANTCKNLQNHRIQSIVTWLKLFLRLRTLYTSFRFQKVVLIEMGRAMNISCWLMVGREGKNICPM